MNGNATAVRRLAPWLLPPAALAAAWLLCGVFRTDDLYIYLRMARNVLEGRGWGFNAGEAVNVASSPIWFFSLLGRGKVGLLSPAAAQVLSALAWLAALGGGMELARRLGGERARWIAFAALALDPWIVRWSWSGMEAGLAAALAAWGLALRLDAGTSKRAAWGSGALLALAPLARPELAVLPCAVLLAEWTTRRGRTLRRAASLVAPTAVFGAAWLAFSLAVWGSPVPSTAIAKGPGESLAGIVASLARTGAVLGSTQALFIAAGLWEALRRARGADDDAASGRAALLFAAGLAGIYALYGVVVYTRYVAPLVAAVVPFGAAAIARAAGAAAPRRRAVAVGACLAALAFEAVFAATVVAPRTRAYARSMDQCVAPLAAEVARRTAPGDLIALHDIGLMGWVTDRPVLDLNGLATPAIVPFRRAGREWEYAARRRPKVHVAVSPIPGTPEARFGDLEGKLFSSCRFEWLFPGGERWFYVTAYDLAPATPTPAPGAPSGTARDAGVPPRGPSAAGGAAAEGSR
ncbi:hypothetical protein LLG88_08740 [bacterium]|nr:hypothetical protein [bacterium]